MHGEIHLDALAVFLIIGFLLSFVLRIMVHSLVRWMKHVAYLKKLAGGTLIVDAEASYWFKLISDPTYVPQWRWTYGEQWKKQKHAAPREGKRSLARKIGYVNMILVIIILAAVFMPSIVGFFKFTPVEVQTETRMAVYGLGNLTLTGSNSFSGWTLRVNGTEYGGWYPGGYIAALIGIERTDSAFATRDVILNLTSYLYLEADAFTPYVVNATWYIQVLDNPSLFNVSVIEGDGSETFFGVPIQLPSDVRMYFIVVIGLRDFFSNSSENYATLTATGSGDDSKISFYGGPSYRIGID